MGSVCPCPSPQAISFHCFATCGPFPPGKAAQPCVRLPPAPHRLYFSWGTGGGGEQGSSLLQRHSMQVITLQCAFQACRRLDFYVIGAFWAQTRAAQLSQTHTQVPCFPPLPSQQSKELMVSFSFCLKPGKTQDCPSPAASGNAEDGEGSFSGVKGRRKSKAFRAERRS